MSRLHILEQGSMDVYSVVVHAPTPSGNNSAGVSWATALQNSGGATGVKTRMTVGNGPGQISQNEANQVSGGTIIEAAFQWQDDPAWTPAERTADLAVRAQQAVDDAVARFQMRLKWYGQVVE